MANNPIDTNSFRHFLLIRGVETEISEPDNFDQSNFKIVQDDIARDTYFGNEEAQLEFYVNFGAPTSTFMDNNGVLISHLPSGAELLIEENKNYGNEADVKYILKKDNVDLTIGNIDFNKDYDSDNETYVKCRVIQNTNQFLIKKREDITIDLLSDKDLDDNTITPIPIQKMFLKAKSFYGESKWEQNAAISGNFIGYGQDALGVRAVNVLKEFTLEDSLIPMERTYLMSPLYSAAELEQQLDFSKIIRAKEDLTNVVIKIKGVTLSAATSGLNVTASFDIRFGTTFTLGTFTTHNLASDSGVFLDVVNQDYEYTINNLPAGGWIGIDFTMFQSYSLPGATPVSNTTYSFSCESIEITGTATAISSVGFAVRKIDAIKQNYKAIGSLPVNAPKYDVGGEFYDNFLFTKNLIKQDLTKPFYLKLKDTKEQLLEQCAYAQINDNEIFIGQYGDFYQNIDMGGFIEVAEYESSIYKNAKYLVNKYIFGYEKYEQDRTEKNTIDAIHTNTEWFVQANNSINSKEFKLPFIRDPFITEVARKLVFSVKENSTTDDDNIFISDVVTLPPNSRNKFTRLVSWQANGILGTTKILSDNTFDWTLLGFQVGDTIIQSGVSRVVLAMTPTLLTLSFVGGVANGTSYLTFDYPLTNVLYTNRTSEGLIFSDNLRNADNFGNLRYSIKRNMRHWKHVLATYGKFIFDKKVKNTYFKANGECTTQFLGEPLPIKENEDILISDIADEKILSQDMYKTSVKISWSAAVQLLQDIQNVRGFIRVQNPSGAIVKGYIKEGNNFWSDGILNLELEVKNESDFLVVTFASGTLTINEVGYDTQNTTEKRYNIFNDFIQFFDENNINLCNRTKFDKVSLNGITYTNIDELVNALEIL